MSWAFEVRHTHVFESASPALEASIRKILQETIMPTLDDLVTKVAEQTGEVASMRVFVAGLEQQIKDALAGVVLSPEAQAKLDGVFVALDANTEQIKAAIDSNPDT